MGEAADAAKGYDLKAQSYAWLEAEGENFFSSINQSTN
jgi:hypothetical protein